MDDLAHQLHVPLRHRLPPFLGKPFGGSTGLVDVLVRRSPSNAAPDPYENEGPGFRHPSSRCAARQTRQLVDDCEDNAVAEIANLPWLDLILVIGAHPLREERSH